MYAHSGACSEEECNSEYSDDDSDYHCKNCSVINTPNLLYAHTNMVEGVSMEQIWCVYHTIVWCVYHTIVYIGKLVTWCHSQCEYGYLVACPIYKYLGLLMNIHLGGAGGGIY